MAKRVISGRALKFLFASGILRGKGSGKNRTVTYDKARAATVSRNRKRGVDVTSRKKASQVNKSGRHVFGGSKAARLRGGAGGRTMPTRAERIAAGRALAVRRIMGAGVMDARNGKGHTALAVTSRWTQERLSRRGDKSTGAAFQEIRAKYRSERDTTLAARAAAYGRTGRDVPRRMQFIDRSGERVPRPPPRTGPDAPRRERIAAGMQRFESWATKRLSGLQKANKGMSPEKLIRTKFPEGKRGAMYRAVVTGALDKKNPRRATFKALREAGIGGKWRG